MIFHQTGKWMLFWVWAVMLFSVVRLILAVPLRSQWGPQQLTAAYAANLCSLVALIGVILPLTPERKRVASLGLMQFIRYSGKYLMLSHLMVALLTAFTAMSFGHCWGTQVQGSGLLVFIVSCFLLFRFTVNNDKAYKETKPYQ